MNPKVKHISILCGVPSLFLTLALILGINFVLASSSIRESSILENKLIGLPASNFSIVYDFTDYASCSPKCTDRTIQYNSSTNELVFLDNLDERKIVNISHLGKAEQSILQEAVPHLRYLNFTDNTCKLRQPYCVASRLSVIGNVGLGEYHTVSEWSFLTSDMIKNAQKIAHTLANSVNPNSTMGRRNDTISSNLTSTD